MYAFNMMCSGKGTTMETIKGSVVASHLVGGGKKDEQGEHKGSSEW